MTKSQIQPEVTARAPGLTEMSKGLRVPPAKKLSPSWIKSGFLWHQMLTGSESSQSGGWAPPRVTSGVGGRLGPWCTCFSQTSRGRWAGPAHTAGSPRSGLL